LEVSDCSSVWKRVSVVLGCCWTCEGDDVEEFDDGEGVTEVVVAENEPIFCDPAIIVVVDVPVLPGGDTGG
jgi:hypothetical protein